MRPYNFLSTEKVFSARKDNNEKKRCFFLKERNMTKAEYEDCPVGVKNSSDIKHLSETFDIKLAAMVERIEEKIDGMNDKIQVEFKQMNDKIQAMK